MSNLIRFRRLNRKRWEIAFSEAHLFEKLDGEMAEIIMPAKPRYVRLWYKLHSPQAQNAPPATETGAGKG